jgi:hypothetical protein
MRPLDTIRAIGRPIAYHAGLARHVGGVATAIFLGQLMYWDEISKDEMGVYKTSEEWESETGLSYREQATARKKLRDLGLLVETVKRLQHRIYYKLDREGFNLWIESLSASDENAIAEPAKAQSPNDENAIGELRNAQSGECGKRTSTDDENATRYIDKDYQETTAEITRTSLSGSAEPNEVARAASRFPEFWAEYPNTPRRVAKGKCLQVWKAKRLDAVADDVLSHLKAIRTTAQWLDGYEPAPLTYLRQERWEDGLPDSKSVTSRHGGPSTLYEQNMAAAARAKAMIFGGHDVPV